MVKIGRDYDRVPSWLQLNRSNTPDFVVDDPKRAPVWEVAGAEFTESPGHTAGGISIRFPRVTRIRDDKEWDGATTLALLQNLVKTSKTRTLSKMKTAGKARKRAQPSADDDDDDIGGGGGGASGGGGAAAASSAGGQKRARAGSAKSSPSIFDMAKAAGARKRQAGDGAVSAAADTESEVETDCEGDLPSLFQSADDGMSNEEEGAAAAAARDSSGAPTFELPPLFSGMLFRVDQSVAGCRDLCRVILTCDGDLLSLCAAGDAAGRQVHRVVDKPGPASRRRAGREAEVSAAWVWQCVAAGRLVDA